MSLQIKILLYTFSFYVLFKCDIGLQNVQSLANISLGTDFRAKPIEVTIISIKFSTKNIVYIFLMRRIVLALEVRECLDKAVKGLLPKRCTISE